MTSNTNVFIMFIDNKVFIGDEVFNEHWLSKIIKIKMELSKLGNSD